MDPYIIGDPFLKLHIPFSKPKSNGGSIALNFTTIVMDIPKPNGPDISIGMSLVEV